MYKYTGPLRTDPRHTSIKTLSNCAICEPLPLDGGDNAISFLSHTLGTTLELGSIGQQQNRAG